MGFFFFNSVDYVVGVDVNGFSPDLLFDWELGIIRNLELFNCSSWNRQLEIIKSKKTDNFFKIL